MFKRDKKMEDDCKQCRYYYLYEMITTGSYSYSEKIPCLTCSRFSIIQDNFESRDGEVEDEVA